MVGQSTRRIINLGTSKGITLPKEFIDRLEKDEVYVFFDHNMLIVLTEEPSAQSFANALIEQLRVTGATT